MLSYALPEAIELLSSKLVAAERNRENAIQVGTRLVCAQLEFSGGSLSNFNVNKDLEFLREQITVMEVNTARVYNWDVKRRRERRQRGELEG